MPRLSSIGFAPAVTFLRPSRKMAWASTVAVVVPSPARSDVLVATSFTICAPMFSIASLSSISFATVTPSLVIVGEPNFLSMTTFRPLGPRVTFTASASGVNAPLELRAGVGVEHQFLGSHCQSLSPGYVGDGTQLIFASTSDALMMITSSPSTVNGVPLYFPYSTLSPTSRPS